MIEQRKRREDTLRHAAVICMIIAGDIFLYLKFYRGLTTVAAGLFFCILYLLSVRFPQKAGAAVLWLVKYRYAVGIGVILLCTLLRISNSSINSMDLYLKDTNGPGSAVLWGIPHPMRSDEWAVQSQYYLSQAANSYRLYNPFLMSGMGQNMIVGYNAPVWDITSLVKPATWGYLLLGAERGIAFYTSFKQVFLLLFSFDLCMLLTKKNLPLSLLGGFWLAYSPAIQWWFSPHFVDVVFWAFALLLSSYHFFTAKDGRRRLLFTALTGASFCAFALAVFPSLQITLGLAAAGLLAALLLRDKAEITFKKIHFFYIAGAFLFIGGILGWFFITSGDALKLVMTSSYPGDRITLGGGSTFEQLFTNLTTVFLPYRDVNYSNNSELSSFFHFAPALLLLLPLFIKRKVKNLGVGVALSASLLVCMGWMYITFPAFVARLTLFSYVNRITFTYGLLATLYTIWTISVIVQNKDILSRGVKWLITGGFLVANLLFLAGPKMQYFSEKWSILLYGAEIPLLCVILLCILYAKTKWLTAFVVLVIFLSGVTVNPIVVGNGSLTNKTLAAEAGKIAQTDSSAYFLTEGLPFPVNNLLAAGGVKNFSATDFYMDAETWKQIDPGGEYWDAYNRYAHKTVTFTAEKTSVIVVQPDLIQVNLSYADLLKLKVSYVISPRELESISADGVSFQKVYDCPNDPDIYAVVAKEAQRPAP